LKTTVSAATYSESNDAVGSNYLTGLLLAQSGEKLQEKYDIL